MDKKLILAVAGSGKTTNILNHLPHDKSSLVVTYTNNNYRTLREGIIRRFGHFPENLTLLTYFSFLYTFCYRPLISYRLRAKGINYKPNPNMYIPQFKKGTKIIEPNHFVDPQNRLYSNRIAKLLLLAGVNEEMNSRLEKYFDYFYIDEVQDLAGYDFNLLESIAQGQVNLMYVGDFYQHTFETSRDGSVNKSLHDDYAKYLSRFEKMNIDIDEEMLIKSYRCSPSVCNFIREHLNIDIHSNRDDDTNIYILESQEAADEIIQDNEIVKLFYNRHHEYECYSRNWGATKGENRYQDVCVVLNKTTANLFKIGKLSDLKPMTKNKLYVACSRANAHLFLVNDTFLEKYKKK